MLFPQVAAELAASAFGETFGKEPYPFQMDVLQHLYPMLHEDIPSRHVFLCQPTGGGKSAVRDTYASGDPGITLSLSPLLALNGDQTTKLNHRSLSCGIRAVHYDEYRNDPKIGTLEDTLIDEASRMSVVLFCSPQMLTDRIPSQLFLDRIITAGLLRMVCIDEVHLFVEFGLYFRKEFLDLRPLLFDRLVSLQSDERQETVCPILVMTATATKELKEQVESLTGFVFSDEDVFWPDVHGMKCRNQTIQFIPHAQPIRAFKPMMERRIKAEEGFIYYSNRRLNVERAALGLRSFLDAGTLPGDIVVIIGPFSREQKFHRIKLFLNPNSLPADSLGDFSAVGCVTTRSLGAAGWDSDSIHLVFSSDMVTNILSIAQEKGRSGRRDGADGTADFYVVAFDLDDYLYLVKRAHRGASGDDINITDFEALELTLKDYTDLQLADHLEVLRFFLIPNECQHCILERRLANPSFDSSSVPLEPCGSLCQYCNDSGQVHKSFERFVRKGIERALVDVFFGPNKLLAPILDGDESPLVNALTNYPNAQKLFFDSSAAKKPEKAVIKRVLMMLLAVQILDIRYVVETIPSANGGDDVKVDTLQAYVPLLSDFSPAFTDDARWAPLPTKVRKAPLP